jgi:hypothetical protein
MSDVNVGCFTRLVMSSRQVELLPARSTDADEYGVKALSEKTLEARDGSVVANVDSHVENHPRLFFENLFGQAKRGDVRAHQSAGLVVLLEDRDLVAERHEIIGDGERRRSRADAGNSSSILLAWNGGQPVADVPSQVARDALQTTDGDGRAIDARATTGRFARSVTRATEDAGKDV